jgi:hypothetical protein
MAVDPTTIGSTLDEKIGAAFTGETFRELGEAGATVETIGANAWLVASADVPPHHIAEFIELISGFRDSVTGTQPYLGFEKLAAAFVSTAQEKTRRLWSAALALFGAQFLTLLSSWQFMSSMTTWKWRKHYWRRYLLLKRNVAQWSYGQEDAWQVGIQELERQFRQLLLDLDEACERGRLSIAHRDHLVPQIKDVENELVRIVRLHLRELFQVAGDYEARRRCAVRWLRRGYIDAAEYNQLVNGPAAT